MASIIPNQTNLNNTSYFPAIGGGGGGGGNLYPFVSSIGLDPAFSTSGTIVMNVSTVGGSQTVNVSQPFTLSNGHAYTIAWKPTWTVQDGNPNSSFASLECSLGGSANLAGKFYSPSLGQVSGLNNPQIEIVGTFRNDVSSNTSAQLVIKTVDYSANPTGTQFSSIVTSLTGKDVVPVLIDYGVVA